MATVEDVLIPASALPSLDAGADRVDVPARVYRPANRADARVASRGLVWLHGGGFVHGDLDMAEGDGVARRAADEGYTVLSVDYRLVGGGDVPGREFPAEASDRFPAAHDDVRAAFSWMTAHAARLGIDPDRIALGGASAGGNIAAGVALHLARTPHLTGPSEVFLAYPVAHAQLPDHDDDTAAAVAGLPEDRRFRPDVVRAMNLNYVGDEALLSDPRAFPGGHDLTGFPRTLIINSEHDDLRSSGEAFARELTQAGVDATCVYEPGATHGHLNRPDEPFAERTLTTFLTWLADSEQH